MSDKIAVMKWLGAGPETVVYSDGSTRNGIVWAHRMAEPSFRLTAGVRYDLDDPPIALNNGPWLALVDWPLKPKRPKVLLKDRAGRTDAWTSDGKRGGWETVHSPGFRRSKFVAGRRYSWMMSEVARETADGFGWLCVADFTGPNYVEPKAAAPEPKPEAKPADKTSAERQSAQEDEARRCQDAFDTHIHIATKSAQAEALRSLRTDWDNLPDAEPESSILPRPR